MHLGFSYIGLIFLLMLFVPNTLWTGNKPRDYDKYALNERKLFVILERIGEAATSCLVLIFADFNPKRISIWLVWFVLAVVLMILYEVYWVRYFLSAKTMQDFYSSLIGIPVAGATLPVIGFLFLGIYGKNIFLIIAVIVLGIGHIGIHLEHKKEIEQNTK